jgi:recombination protein RecA
MRMKIGVMFGNPETTSGGNALKFYSSLRLDIRRIGAIKKGNDVIGNRTRVKVVKNKLAPPFRVCEFDILFNEGISKIGDLIDLSVEAQIIDKSGAWYAYRDERLGQGRENVRDTLLENETVRESIENQVREHYGMTPRPPPKEEPAKDGGNGKDPKEHTQPAPSPRKSRTARS